MGIVDPLNPDAHRALLTWMLQQYRSLPLSPGQLHAALQQWLSSHIARCQFFSAGEGQ